jgi:hypothetical protein
MPFTREVFPDTQRLLQRLYQQSRHHQVRQRAHCILLRTQGYRISQLMEIFLVSRKTLYNWFNAWETQGLVGLYNRSGRGRKPTFNGEQIEQIRAWTQQYPRQLKQVVHKVQQQWDITVSTKTIKRVLKALRMSWHRYRRVVGGQPDHQEYAHKCVQLEALKQLDERGEIDLYYLDEAGFCLIPCIPYGWQPVGETLGIESRRSRRLNVLGLMSRSHQLETYVSLQSITSDVVIACIPASNLPVDAHPAWMDATTIPPSIQEKAQELGASVSSQQWAALTPAQRFALIKLSRPSHENKNFLPTLKEFQLV